MGDKYYFFGQYDLETKDKVKSDTKKTRSAHKAI